MKIGIDAREIQDGVVTGIGRSLANFIRYFVKNEKRHQLVFFSEKRLPPGFENTVGQVTIEACPTFFWDQWKLQRAIKANKIDLFYSPYYKVPLLTEIPTVSQILDLMFLVFPPYREALGLWRRSYYATFGRACARKSISIITDSEHARQDIIRIWKIDPKKIAVIPLGIADRYVPVEDGGLLTRVRERLNLPENYLLYLGNFKPHKNVESLVQAFSRIARRFPDHKLVLAGPLDAHGLQIQDLVSRRGLRDSVVFTDTIKEENHPEALLSMADLFIFPTLYEGFGLPPLEAMACGTPVITSNVTAVPEVVGDAGVMVNPLDVDELTRAIEDLLRDREKRAYHSQRGLERSKLFREEDTAGKIHRHIINLVECLR